VSESQLLARRRDRLAARVDLILALGGGFDDEPQARELQAREPAARRDGAIAGAFMESAP
jgi:hypothetical protein